MLVVSYNNRGQVECVVNAESKALAVAYFQGLGIEQHQVKTEEEFDFKNNGTGVVPIMKTRLVNIDRLNKGSEILTVSR